MEKPPLYRESEDRCNASELPQRIEYRSQEGLSVLSVPKNTDIEKIKHELHEFSASAHPGLRICFSPGLRLDAAMFPELFPQGTITGDGAVNGSVNGWYENLDHHGEHEDRLSMPSMCEQVQQGLRSGRFKSFTNSVGQIDTLLFLNHLDQDGALAALQLQLSHSLNEGQRKNMDKLTHLVGRADAHAGLLVQPERDAQETKWWAQPILEARKKHDWILSDISIDEFMELYGRLQGRTMDYLNGKQRRVELDERYEGKGYGWGHLIREVGTEARRGMAKKYIRRFMTHRGERSDGKHVHSFVNFEHDRDRKGLFPTIDLCKRLNRLEAISPDFHDRDLQTQWNRSLIESSDSAVWGGDQVGGSFGGSRFSSDKMPEVISFLLNQIRGEQVMEATLKPMSRTTRTHLKVISAFGRA